MHPWVCGNGLLIFSSAAQKRNYGLLCRLWVICLHQSSLVECWHFDERRTIGSPEIYGCEECGATASAKTSAPRSCESFGTLVFSLIIDSECFFSSGSDSLEYTVIVPGCSLTKVLLINLTLMLWSRAMWVIRRVRFSTPYYSDSGMVISAIFSTFNLPHKKPSLFPGILPAVIPKLKVIQELNHLLLRGPE